MQQKAKTVNIDLGSSLQFAIRGLFSCYDFWKSQIAQRLKYQQKYILEVNYLLFIYINIV